MATKKKKAAAPKVPSAAKLKDLQTKLNKDKLHRQVQRGVYRAHEHGTFKRCPTLRPATCRANQFDFAAITSQVRASRAAK